jgi:hypothetical protein
MKTIKLFTTNHSPQIKVKPPEIKIDKLGIVSRYYNFKDGNKYRDFSYAFKDILKLLDEKKCDSVLFSLFTIDSRSGFVVDAYLKELKNIKAVFIEEFKDKGKDDREVKKYIIYLRTKTHWQEYDFSQKFGTLNHTKNNRKEIIEPYLDETKNRIIGNCAIILCGEINIVKYSRYEKKIIDPYGYLHRIPDTVELFLNPIHDRMTRFEMPMKMKFLSQNNRWTVSVWNKGKKDKNGNIRDGNIPPWKVFHNGKKIEIMKIANCPILSKINIEIGILNINRVGEISQIR